MAGITSCKFDYLLALAVTDINSSPIERVGPVLEDRGITEQQYDDLKVLRERKGPVGRKALQGALCDPAGWFPAVSRSSLPSFCEGLLAEPLSGISIRCNECHRRQHP